MKDYEYLVTQNTDRYRNDISFDKSPPIYAIIQIEDELVWHNPENHFVRGVGGTEVDRHFQNTIARVVGIAEPLWYGDDL